MQKQLNHESRKRGKNGADWDKIFKKTRALFIDLKIKFG